MSSSLFAELEPARRIAGRDVPALTPDTGSIFALIMGEAPGPRGADQSGFPFFGDRAGRLVYRALRTAGCASWPHFGDTIEWKGAQLAAAGLRPVVQGVMLTNAFPRCPTDDGQRFRAPKRAELQSDANRARLLAEFTLAASRGCRMAIGLGRVSGRIVETIGLETMPGIEVVSLPHPSPQGLLQAEPEQGKGHSMVRLEAKWIGRLVALLQRAVAGT